MSENNWNIDKDKETGANYENPAFPNGVPGEFYPLPSEPLTKKDTRSKAKMIKKNLKAEKRRSKNEARDLGVYKKGPFKKFISLATTGILIGVFAGFSFLGVNYGVDTLTTSDQEQTVISEQSGIQSDAKENATITQMASDDKVASTETASVIATDVSGVVKKVMPSVVSIVNNYTATSNYFGQDFSEEAAASGSGIIVGENDSELLIVTNYHVVADAETLEVQFIDETTAEAVIKGYDSDVDLAVIAIPLTDLTQQTKEGIAIATLGDSDALQVGEPAIAIGNALGYGQSVTTGVISALNRELTVENVTNSLIQTDAAINPGNSGGALLNMNGEVIGINSNKIGGDTIEGMGYAIPISSAKPIITELMQKETRLKVDEGQKGYLGIYGVNVTEDVAQMYGMPEGVYVSQVAEDNAAEQAGIQEGDIITKFDGTTVSTMEELQGLLEYYEVGSAAEVVLQRGSGADYQEITVTVTLGEKFN